MGTRASYIGSTEKGALTGGGGGAHDVACRV